jgi:hypothetical protein
MSGTNIGYNSVGLHQVTLPGRGGLMTSGVNEAGGPTAYVVS